MTRTSKALFALALAGGLVACNGTKQPGLPSVVIVSPVDGGILDGDAGTVANGLLTFTVTAQSTGFAPNASASIFEDGSKVAANTQQVNDNGGATFSITLSGSPSGTSHTLTVTVIDTANHQATSATITVSVVIKSSGVCPISISPADNSLFNETGTTVTIASQTFNTVRDEDVTMAGMQARITATVGAPCLDGTTVTLTVGNAAPLTATLASGVAVFNATDLPDTSVTAVGDSSQKLKITVNAGSALMASSDIIYYLVYSQNPTISITSPADGAIIPQANQPVTVTGITDLAPEGQIVQLDSLTVDILAEDGGLYGSGPLESDAGFSISVTLPVGADALTAQVTDAFENVGASGPVIVTITPNGANCSDAGSPTVMFSTPAAGASFNLAADENSAQLGFQTPLRITTSSMTGLAVFCSTVAPTAVGATPCAFNPNLFELGNPVPVSGGSAILDAATLGDDRAAPDQTITAQVTDGVCGTTGEGLVIVEVHALQPVINSVVVQNEFGNSDGGCVWLNSTNLQNGTAQTTVVVTVDGSDEFGDGGPVLTITGPTNQVDTAPLTGTGMPSADVPISLPDGTYSVSATITDVWGNPSAAEQFDICVKTSLPTCTLSDSYSNGCFNIQDNGGVSGNGAQSVTLTVTATNESGSDINGNPIPGSASVSLNGGAPVSNSISGVVQVSVASAQGADVYSATVTDPAGNPPATCVPTSLNLNVSTVTPTLSVSSTSGTGVDDAGCEIYTTRDGIPVSVTTSGFANGASITLQATGANGGGSAKTPATVTNNSASASLSGLPNGIDTIAATGADSCGNPGTSGVPATCVDIQAPGCDLSIVTPVPTQTDAGESVVFNGTQVTGGIVGIELHTSCAAGTQVQFDSTPNGGSDQPQDGGVDANGDVTFDLSGLVDGSNGTFTADISGGETLPTISYDAKLSKPDFTGETPVAGNLEIVATQDNLILSDAGVTSLAVDGGTIIANEAQCIASACADFTITGITGLGPVDGNGNIGTASLALNFGGGTTNPNPITIANGTTSVTFTAVNMPAVSYPTAGTVTLTLTDNVGNIKTEIWDVTTDSLQPQAPTVTAGMSDKRNASVLLSWTVPATDGDSATQGYELAYVVNNLRATPPAIPSETTYGTWTLDTGIAGLTGAVGAKLTYTAKNLPTLNQYTFELRAIDAVGNRSPLAADANAVSVSSTDANAWQTLTLLDPANDGADSDFGYVLRVGDFNNDGLQDLVLTAPYQFASNPTPGIVYILSGAQILADAGTAGLTSITLGGTDYDYFGQDAHVADFNGDGIDDLAVGAPNYNGGQGRVDIFFGSAAGIATTPSTTILGDSTSAGQFGFSVTAANVNGDKFSDLIVGAPAMGSSNNGASYVFVGSGNWPLPDAGADVTSATCTISGNAGDVIGARGGTVSLGNIDQNVAGDEAVAIGAPGGGGTNGDAGSGQEYGFSGSTLTSNSTIDLSTTAGTSLLLFDLVGRVGGFCDPTNYGYNSGGFWACFGEDAVDANFTGGKVNDLVVSSTQLQGIFLYTMTKTGPTTPVTFSDGTEDESAGGNVGWSMAAADITGDGHTDLLAGENNSASPNVYLYINTGTGLTVPPGGELFGPDGGFFGTSVAAGDFQGSGNQDFAVSDDYPSAYVNVYY